MIDKYEREMRRRTHEEARRCIHFNGVMNDECDAGVNYHELLGTDPGCFANMPCFNDKSNYVKCSKAQFMSMAEARTKVDEREIRIQEYIKQLNDGTCPTCGVKVKQRQVGPCVYGTCGHRLYQGKVNPEFVVEEKRIHSMRKTAR